MLGLALSIAGLLSVVKTAQAADDFYLGAGVGRSRVADWCDNVGQFSAQLSPFFGSGTDCNEGSTAFNLYAGYRFLPYLAVEAGYTDFGKATLRFGTASAEVRGWGVPVYVVGILPLANDHLWLMA